jgi:hypothetical protein
MDGPVGNVDLDGVALFHQADRAAGRRFRRGVADRQARGAAGEAAVGEQRAGLAQALRFQVRGRVEHFLHAGAALRAFVAHDHDVAGDDLVGEDFLHRLFLRLADPGAAGEFQDRLVDAGGLDDAALLGDVAEEHGQAAILRIGVGLVADAAVGAVEVERRIAAALREGGLRRHAARRGAVELMHAGAWLRLTSQQSSASPMVG